MTPISRPDEATKAKNRGRVWAIDSSSPRRASSSTSSAPVGPSGSAASSSTLSRSSIGGSIARAWSKLRQPAITISVARSERLLARDVETKAHESRIGVARFRERNPGATRSAGCAASVRPPGELERRGPPEGEPRRLRACDRAGDPAGSSSRRPTAPAISIRARCAPRQKCSPKENERWRRAFSRRLS